MARVYLPSPVKSRQVLKKVVTVTSLNTRTLLLGFSWFRCLAFGKPIADFKAKSERAQADITFYTRFPRTESRTKGQ